MAIEDSVCVGHIGSQSRLPRHRSAIGRALVAATLTACMITGITPAIAQPVNPDDVAIEQAQDNVEANNGEVARLAGSVSSADSEISRLELEMGALREEVNKALVDLHDAQAAAEQARQNAAAAKADLDDSQVQIEAAQERLNELSRAAYRQNGTSKGISGISGNEANEDALARQTYLRTTAEKQREAVAELDRLRTENANKESSLREARNVAEQREAEAVAKEQEARAAIDANSAELSVLNANRTTLVAQRQEAERLLAESRNNVDSLNEQRQEYEDYQQAEQERLAAEAEAAAAAEEKRKAEEAVAAAVAEQQAAEQRAAEKQAASQAASLQQAQEAKEAAERAQAEADQRAADDAAAQAVRDQALAAASAAAAALIAASQADHTTTDNPYPSGEDATSGDIAAIQTPDDSGELSAIDSSVNNLDQVTENATAVVSGDRSARIETAISRAMAQIGTPYAWGGGDANGPTLGIRDGGVADSYGDYNKVGFDCSGLVLYAFAGVGIALPHYTGYQYQRGTKVSPSEMQRGDLIFYGPNASQHVAIYLGNGQMIEAPQSGSTVQVSSVRWSGMTEYAVRLI